MHALAKMAKMAINRQNRQTVNKIQMRWERGPLESGDFDENGVFTKGRECSFKPTKPNFMTHS